MADFTADCLERIEVALAEVLRRVEDNAPHQGDASESSAGIDDRAALRQEYIFANKTAALFVAAAEMGALSVDASPAAIEALKSYAYNLGFAFQYQDDLLDADDGAFSSLALFGADEVRRRVVEHTNIAISSLSSLPGTISPLKDLADHLLSRNC